MRQERIKKSLKGRVVSLRKSSTFYDLFKYHQMQGRDLELRAKLQSPLDLDQSAIKFLSSGRMIT